MLTKINRLGQTGVFHGTLQVQEHIFEPGMVDSARGTRIESLESSLEQLLFHATTKIYEDAIERVPCAQEGRETSRAH